MRSGVRDNLHLRQPAIVALVRPQRHHLTRIQVQVVVDDAILDEPIVWRQWR